LKLFGQYVNLQDGSTLLQDELLPKAKDGFFTHVLHLIITAGGRQGLEIC